MGSTLAGYTDGRVAARTPAELAERAPAAAPSTLVQKLLARAAGRAGAHSGDPLACRIDLALLDDGVGDNALQALLREVGDGWHDRSRVVLALQGADAGAGHLGAAAQLPHVYRGLGLPALVLAQAAHLRPGQLAVACDAEAAVVGALGALMLAVDAPTMLAALCRGVLTLAVPPTVFMRWSGRLGLGVGAHDMALHMHSRLAGRGTAGAVIEYGGEAVAALPIGERMTLAAMSCALGALSGVVAPDQATWRWLHDAGLVLAGADLAPWRSDEDAPGARHAFDASTLTPQVALPDPAPRHAGAAWRVRPLAELDASRIDVACLGGVTGAKLDDLRAAARVLAGYRIAPGVQLLVAPASRLDREIAAREGILRRLVEAGATLLPGTRALGHALADSTVIASCQRPFAGRAGPGTGAPVLHASPFTVAASALRGRLADAREVLS